MSNDDKLKLVASYALKSLFSSRGIATPISAFDLLARVISSGAPPAGLLSGPGPHPSFRLTDLAKFEHALECLSQEWDHGRIALSRDEDTGETTVVEVQLGQPSTRGSTPNIPHGKKRKRVVDEDADSAAGDAEEEEKEDESAPRTTALSPLDGLSKEMREVYALLQKGTARGRLLAEQVSYTAVCPCAKLINVITSSIRRIPVLSLYALALRKRTVLKHAVLRTTTTNP